MLRDAIFQRESLTAYAKAESEDDIDLSTMMGAASKCFVNLRLIIWSMKTDPLDMILFTA